jgi:hypothetical protein
LHYLSIIEQGPLVLQKPSAFWGEISYVTAGVAAGVILVAGLSRSCPSPFSSPCCMPRKDAWLTFLSNTSRAMHHGPRVFLFFSSFQ